jgi:choline-sulfatase
MYVVFTSDHGEMLGDHGLFNKSLAYEASLRVPLIVGGPGTAGGRVSDSLVEQIDLDLTLCEVAALDPQPNLNGRPFAPVLGGELTAHRADTVAALGHPRCLRTERYKYIENYNDAAELYDLAEDPAEQRDLAADRRDLCREMRRRLVSRHMGARWNR